MNPLELKTEEEWDEILGRFGGQIEMTACLSDDTGSQPRCRGDRFPLCAAVRASPEATRFICSQTNTAMLAVVRQTLRPAIDLCEAGLIRLVVPLVRDGRLVGQVFACGPAPQDEELEPFLIAQQLGISEERVLELAQSTPASSEEKLRPLVDRLFDELNPRVPCKEER